MVCLIVLQSAIAECLSFAGVTCESSPGVLRIAESLSTEVLPATTCQKSSPGVLQVVI